MPVTVTNLQVIYIYTYILQKYAKVFLQNLFFPTILTTSCPASGHHTVGIRSWRQDSSGGLIYKKIANFTLSKLRTVKK